MKKVTLKLIGKILYCYVLPTLGTSFLIISMFHRDIDSVSVSPESDTLILVAALILCASTWFAAFQYWNAFLREYDMPEDQYVEYFDSILNDPDSMHDYEYGPGPEMEELYPTTYDKVELDSPIKGVCLPFVCEYTEDWQKERGGWGNGYVLISSDHPACGLQSEDEQVPCFGEELTFSGQFSQEMLELCGISREIAKDADMYWVFGFDTMHVWNNRVTNNETWVRSRAVELAFKFQNAFYSETEA